MLYKKILTWGSTRPLIAKCRDGSPVRLTLYLYVFLVNLNAAKLLTRLECGSERVTVCGVDLAFRQLDEFYWLIDYNVCKALKKGVDEGRIRREKEIWTVMVLDSENRGSAS